MKLSTALFAAVILLSGFTRPDARTGSVKSFSLAEAQEHAIDHFYLSKNADLDVEASKWRVWESTAMGLPQVSTSASYQHIPGEIPTLSFGEDMPFPMEPTPIAVKNSINYSATVSQLLFSGEYIVGLQAARVYRSLSEKAGDKTEIEIKQQVADVYYSLLLLQKNRVILEKTLENLRTNLGQIRKSYEVGMVEDTEVDQIDLMVQRTENQLASMDRQIVTMTHLFKYTIGLGPDTDVELSDDIDQLIMANMVDEDTYNFILEDNIDYKMLTTQEQLMKLNMNLMRASYLPSVAGFYQYQDKTQKADFDFTINHIIGVQVEFPITTSGSRIAKVSQARVEYEKAMNTREQEANRLIMAAQQASFNYRNAMEKYNNEKQNFELSGKVYTKTTEKYKEGFVSSLELSLINNQYLQAQLSYSMAVQELLSAKTELDKAYNRL